MPAAYRSRQMLFILQGLFLQILVYSLRRNNALRPGNIHRHAATVSLNNTLKVTLHILTLYNIRRQKQKAYGILALLWQLYCTISTQQGRECYFLAKVKNFS